MDDLGVPLFLETKHPSLFILFGVFLSFFFFFFARNPKKAICYFSQVLVPLPAAPSKGPKASSATPQPSCRPRPRLRHPSIKVQATHGFFMFFLSNLREVGSIDPVLEGTGDQSMGCLVMHPDEADLTAGVCFEKFHQNSGTESSQ